MKYAKIDGIDQPIARLILGTFGINSRETEKGWALLDAAFDLGYTTLDTGHAYPSEMAIGQWIEKRKNREKIVIISKCSHPNEVRKRVTPFDMASDLHDSLARLRTDYIDIYLLHRDDPTVPVGPLVEALTEHRRAGRIRAFGASNWTHQRIQQANDYAESHGCEPFLVSSPHFSLAEQVEEPWAPGCVAISGPDASDARDWYTQNQMPVFAYSSLARGFFSGRISRQNFEEIRESIDAPCLHGYCHEPNFQRLDRAYALAAEKGVALPSIALAYVLNQKFDVFPITGAANPEELTASLSTLDLTLSSEELEWLDLTRGSRAVSVRQ